MSDPLAPIKDAATALAEGLGLPSGLRNFSVTALALLDPATGRVVNGGAAGKPVVVDASVTRTLALVDAGTFIRCTASFDPTFTVPPHSSVAFPPFTEIDFQCTGNVVTIASGAGVTVESVAGAQITEGGGVARLKNISTNLWCFYGHTI